MMNTALGLLIPSFILVLKSNIDYRKASNRAETSKAIRLGIVGGAGCAISAGISAISMVIKFLL